MEKKKSEGWICPKCGRVISPYEKSCPYCDKKKNEEKKKDTFPINE